MLPAIPDARTRLAAAQRGSTQPGADLHAELGLLGLSNSAPVALNDLVLPGREHASLAAASSLKEPPLPPPKLPDIAAYRSRAASAAGSVGAQSDAPSVGSENIPRPALIATAPALNQVAAAALALQPQGVQQQAAPQAPMLGPPPAVAVAAADPQQPVQLRVQVVTFNMAGTLPAALPPDFFRQDDRHVDVYVVGTQESCALGDWERLLRDGLGTSYAKRAQESLMAISLLVYVHNSVAPRVKDVRTSSIACGVGNVLGNKGAVGVSLSVDALRLLFINSHLAAHDEHIERRNADYQRIFTGLFSASATTGNVAVPATPGTAASSGASTPRQAESPQRGSSPRLDELAGLSQQQLAANPSLARMSRLAHVSSMSQLPQPAAFNATSFASQPSSARDPPPSPPPAAAGAGGAVEGGGSLSTSSVPPGGVGVAPPAALVPPPLVVGPQQSALPLHDVVFWSGDLNYRINGADAAIRQLLTSDMIEVLHANDQLRLQMRKGKVFQGFYEQAIHFPPTFKYKPGTNEYSAKRIPSWCDRVLHKTYAEEPACILEPAYYKAVPSLMDSDHRAVVAGFDVVFTPGLLTLPAGTSGPGSGCLVA